MPDEYVLRKVRNKHIIWEGTFDECEDKLQEIIWEAWRETSGPDDRDYETFANQMADMYLIEERKRYFTTIARDF